MGESHLFNPNHWHFNASTAIMTVIMSLLLFPIVFLTEIPSNGTASVGRKMKIHDVKRMASLENIKGRMLQRARKQQLCQLIFTWLEQSLMHKKPWKYHRLLYSYTVYMEILNHVEHVLFVCLFVFRTQNLSWSEIFSVFLFLLVFWLWFEFSLVCYIAFIV